MTEAVIEAYGRSPIGRARKGSLVDVRPDDLAAHVVTKVLDKVPELDPTQIEDLICGCGLPGGEQGHNIGRVVSILARLDVPGVTVNRYCSSSLMTTRIAAHAIEAGEGDAFLSVGVQGVSRDGSGYPDAPDTYNPKLGPGNTQGYPDVYIAMGITAANGGTGAPRSSASSRSRASSRPAFRRSSRSSWASARSTPRSRRSSALG